MTRLAVAALLALAACDRPRFDAPEDAAPSPNASILPAPLAQSPAELAPAGSARADNVSSQIASPLEALRGDREVSADPLGPKETLGVTLTGEWRFPDLPGPPKAAEVHLEGIAAARRAMALKWQIALTESGRMRITFDGRAFPVAAGTELRARADRLGHVLVFPGGTDYRPVPPGALRALFGDRRLDVVPLVGGQVTPKGMAPSRAGRAVRRVEIASKMGTLTLDFARVPEAGLGAALLCRTLVELVAVDPATPLCAAEELPLRAQLTWPAGGAIVFEAQDPSKRTDMPLADVLVPPPSAQLVHAMPAQRASVLVSRDEAAAFRTRAIDLPLPGPGAPSEGLLARNMTDSLRYLVLDGVPLAWLMPGGEQLVLGLARGRYTASWRTFLGDANEPPRTVEAPGRITLGEAPDAGAPAPAKSK